MVRSVQETKGYAFNMEWSLENFIIMRSSLESCCLVLCCMSAIALACNDTVPLWKDSREGITTWLIRHNDAVLPICPKFSMFVRRQLPRAGARLAPAFFEMICLPRFYAGRHEM